MAQIGGMKGTAYNRQWMSSMLFPQVDMDINESSFVDHLGIENTKE